MRQKKAIVNSGFNLFTFFITFLPNLIIQQLFLQTLGEDLRGLNGLYTSIIGWLSIIELGVGTAIIFSLYKPFVEKDYSSIRRYLNFYQKFYIKVGVLILGMGIILIPLLPFFIENNNIDIKLINIGFILYLLNSFISYLFSSKLCILTVAQEGYKLSLGTALSKIVLYFLQFIILKSYPNFLLFVGVQLVVNILYYVIINIYILDKYSWIKHKKEELSTLEKQSLMRSVRAMFMHKIGSLFVFGTDNLIISKFLGVAQLGYYLNYNIIISAAQNLISTVLNGLTASIGNLLVNCDYKYALDIHRKLFFINFWIASFVSISLYNTLNQFIALWIGEKYLLDSLSFLILIINCYFSLMRHSIDRFKEASGNYTQDRYAPIIEGIVNIIFSIILVKYLGLSGVFIGTMISNFTVLFWVPPYVVYKYVFKSNVVEYIRMYLKYTSLAILVLFITLPLTAPFKYKYDLLNFIINCLINIIIINICYVIFFFRKGEFHYFIKIFKNIKSI